MEGKLTGDAVRAYVKVFFADANHEHEVEPGMVYISQTTEYGTLYTLAELEDLRAACDEFDLPLYIDGARLGYALTATSNDATLADIARPADAFHIGGTKVGALFDEAVVFPKPALVPRFYTLTRQHGAMLAKGRIQGNQFNELFTDGPYERIARQANVCTGRIAPR